jgi:pilus assembly protein CpaB
MTAVVYARNTIPKHAQLSAADVFVKLLPKETAGIEGTFRGVNLIEGRVTREAIAAGRPLRRDQLLGLDESLPDLAERIPAGHRALTIVVEGAQTGGKRLEEGDRIDIALTVEGTHPDLGELMTRTLMRSVLVVDAAADVPQNRRQKQATDRDAAITVAVTPADANRLIVAQRTGTLQATLVSAADVATAEASEAAPVSRRELLGLHEVAPPRKFTIEKWTGNRVQVIEMSDDRIQESRDVTSHAEAPVMAPAVQGVDRAIPSGVNRPANATLDQPSAVASTR